MILTTCSDHGIAIIAKILKTIFDMILIVGPMLAMVSLAYLFFRIITDRDADKNEVYKKRIRNVVKALLIVVFLPIFVNLIMNITFMKDTFQIAQCFSEAKGISFSTKMSDYKEKKDSGKQKTGTFIIDPSEYVGTDSNPNSTESGTTTSKLNYSNAVTVPDSVLSKASKSDLSVLVVDSNGMVLAERKSHLLREGGSTTKIFTGYAAVTLLDPTKDVVVCTQYAQTMKYAGTPDVKVGNKFSVSKAATKDFPGSSNITAANIAIAIGKKYHNCSSDGEAYLLGMDDINNLLKKVGCEKTHIPSASGVNYNYKTKVGCCNKYGISKGTDGVTAGDLGSITIAAMNNQYFASGISNRNTNGKFYIKSGTQSYKHGVWGFNYKNKRYYIVALGFNFKAEGDLRGIVSNNIYNWTIKNLIK